ncbi:MAG: tRNA (adenosine(37)-N6)-threonylcarbamoyltransferase complex dimerization subunit type 1 TsaB [bacterium]|nr:tRNA (adenosine(37)-N6)-threonylcarbamoyltransferase complex dimerization subunit type 1 TsaB [bacterium]
MKILYIDTSSSYLYAGIVENEKLLCEVKKEFGHSLSEEALPEIAALFGKVNLKPNVIDKIIVVDGPGSFTGIRIGITIAKVYAWSLNIPITTISALEAMSISSNEDSICVPLIDARRGYVFGAIYSDKNEVILAPKYIKLAELIEKIPSSQYSIITNDDLEIDHVIESYNPDILKIVTYFKDKPSKNPHAVNPEYLKLTEAEESKIQ